MVATKFLGLIVTFCFFVVFEAFGQNFYPARYGRSDENDSYQEKRILENRRIGRNEIQDGQNRKMKFFISGGRFGKRGCSENCLQESKSGSKEIISGGFHTRQDRSERIKVPIRKNQFMMGSRFGKRMEGPTGDTDSTDNAESSESKCIILLGMNDFFRCLGKKEPTNDYDSVESSEEFFQ